MRLTVAEIIRLTGGTLVSGVAEGATVDSCSADSRTLSPGALFVAVRGDRDGHEFIEAAVQRGAGAVLAERLPPADLGDVPVIVVAHTLSALADLARGARARLDRTQVVAITGSTGKTSTKDLTAGALAGTRQVWASPASFNNELGVPLTVLSAPDTTEVLVAEIGARGRGHVRAMAEVVRHSIGVVTTIGAAHTEQFGSVAAVAEAKGEMFEALPSHGTAILGTGHDWVDALARRAPGRVVTVGREPSADVRVSRVEVDGVLRPTFLLESPWGRASVTLEVRGAHQAMNAAIAASVAGVLGIDLDAAVHGLTTARGSQWRMEVERSGSGILVLNDAYNANPASTLAAIDALAAVETAGRRWAVLGPMAELGVDAEAEHERVGRTVAERGIDRLVTVGDYGALTARAAAGAGLPPSAIREVADAEEAWAVIEPDASDGDAVLVKASRVAGLEWLARRLVGHEVGAAVPRLTDTDVEGDTGPGHRGGLRP